MKLTKEEMKKEKFYCWNCGTVEIPEPQTCCSGRDCGCMGIPIDPPFCSEKCFKEWQNKKPQTLIIKGDQDEKRNFI